MAKQTNSIAGWRKLAERDMAVAEHLAANMYPVPTEIIAFHCQQAVEKYLKGVLYSRGKSRPIFMIWIDCVSRWKTTAHRLTQ
jgi:HEPN domain-containing protein